VEKPAGQTWLPVPGWDGLYEVSDLGLVWSHYKWQKQRGHLLKTPLDNRNYQQVNLSRGGVKLHTHVHVLVATAFHGPCPPDMECRHLDGNRSNNVASNLKWGTSSENNRDLVRHGTHYARYRGVTHCIYSHEFTPENTGRDVRGNRFCLACRKRRNKEQAARRKAARHRAKAARETAAQDAGQAASVPR
jgi:HNH endonuclease/NUMOD4 motif-containing protein